MLKLRNQHSIGCSGHAKTKQGGGDFCPGQMWFRCSSLRQGMARGEEAEQEGSAGISLAPSARVCFVFSWIWVWRSAEDKVVRAQSWQAACLLWGTQVWQPAHLPAGVLFRICGSCEVRHCRGVREQLQELLGPDPGTGGRRRFGVSSWQDSRGHRGSCSALCLAAREPPIMSRQRPRLPASLCQKDRITTPRSGGPLTRGQLAACSLLLLPLLIQQGAEAVDELPKRQESGGCPAVPRRGARCHLAPAMRDGRGCPCWHLGAFLASLLGLGPVTGGGRLRLSSFCGRVGGCSARANAGSYRFPFLPLFKPGSARNKAFS